MKYRRLSLLVLLFTFLFLPMAIRAENPAPRKQEAQSSTLSPKLRKELRKGAIEYKKEYRGSGASVKIHWQTVFLTILFIAIAL